MHEARDAAGRALGATARPTAAREVAPNPQDHEVVAAFRAHLGQGTDVIVAVGGGSLIDAAEGLVILSSDGGNVLDPCGVDMVSRRTAAMFVDALTHGIESVVSLAHKPLADIHTLRAMALVTHHLRATTTRPADGPTRVGTAQASLDTRPPRQRQGHTRPLRPSRPRGRPPGRPYAGRRGGRAPTPHGAAMLSRTP